jgi:hypothetical protein
VAFSRKRRGFCPSCGTRRMVDSVLHCWWTKCCPGSRCGNGCSACRSSYASSDPSREAL